MSIASAITTAQGRVAAAYSACSAQGVTLPPTQDLSHLPDTISLIGKYRPALPAGYTNYDYIACDGNSYINTGIIASTPIAVSAKIRHTATTGDYVFVGARKDSGDTRLFPIAIYGEYINFAYGAYYMINQSFASDFAAGNPVIVRTSLTSGNLCRDAVVVADAKERRFLANTVGASAADIPLYVFRNNYSTPSHCPSGDRIYWLRIYDDVRFENCVFNGVPCKNAMNAAGLYDLVSGTFFGNAGAGSLTAGND